MIRDLLAARAQMALSLAFHIIFAVIGIAMPLLMVLAERRWLKHRDPVDLELAKRWSKGTAIMFAVGAVSGTVLSFELGLLWPGFMRYAGAIIGMPFSLEGFAFFLEAIFLGIYLYGWDRVPPKAHLFSGVMVLLSGTASGLFVVCANGWMNTPTGFETDASGAVTSIDPLAAMLNPAAIPEAIHMTIAAFEAVGFAVAAIHALALLRAPASVLHKKALSIALLVGTVAALVQPLSGHQSAVHVATHQPVKLAAMEAHWDTHSGVGAVIGGWPDEVAERTDFKLEIPYLMSLLAFNDPNAEIKGLKEWPKEDRPPVAVTHIAFQIMVGIGSWLALLAVVGHHEDRLLAALERLPRERGERDRPAPDPRGALCRLDRGDAARALEGDAAARLDEAGQHRGCLRHLGKRGRRRDVARARLDPGLLDPGLPAGDRDAQHVGRTARGTIRDRARERPHLGPQHRHRGDELLDVGDLALPGARIRHLDDVARGHPVAAQRHAHAHAGLDALEPGRHAVLEQPVELRQARVDDDSGEPLAHRRRGQGGQSPAAARRSSTRSSRSQVKSGSSRPKWP